MSTTSESGSWYLIVNLTIVFVAGTEKNPKCRHCYLPMFQSLQTSRNLDHNGAVLQGDEACGILAVEGKPEFGS